jgi:uncharacterized iron-regulated protein
VGVRPMLALTDQQLAAANMAYTKVLFPECSEAALADEWARMPERFRADTQAAMRAAIAAALAVPDPTASSHTALIERLRDLAHQPYGRVLELCEVVTKAADALAAMPTPAELALRPEP